MYQDGLKLKGTHQLLVYADDISIYGAEAYIGFAIYDLIFSVYILINFSCG